MNSCKQLHDYSYFIASIRENAKKGMRQREAIAYAIDECIENGILEDVLLKHRAEVEDMFLTTFDKKMYEEALRMDAREEGLEEGHKVGLEEGRKAGLEEGRKTGLEEGHKAGLEIGRAEGRAEELANTERERQRAEKAEKENEELRKELAKLKGMEWDYY